jgi:glycerol-3-phosphate dehydrogenase
LRLLKGSHLIFPKKQFPLVRAVSYSHPNDGRPIFAIPWEGVTLFGTTDVDHSQVGLSEPVIDAQEIDYLFAAINQGFPSLSLAEQDVQSTFSGIRAVVDTGKSDPSSESREHVIWPEDGLLTVTGGKLTTFRVMARDALKAVRRWFPDRPEFGDHRTLDAIDPFKMDEFHLTPWEKNRLIGRYGQDARTLIAHAKPDELQVISAETDLTAIWAEVRWAVHSEGVVHLDDLLLRRVRLGLLLPDGADSVMGRIKIIVQDELGWDEERWELEISRYRRIIRFAYSL